MAKSMNVVKRKPGRPPQIGAGTFVGMRLPGSLVESIDGWAKRNKINGRSDAMRRLLELALAGAPAASRLSKSGKRKAAEMAGRQIDLLGDQTATGKERAQRKRRLIKGPREFRDVRGDLPKTET
jgi:hypothetical protein